MIAAEIAKIHTIEWTPQLLYDEPLYLGMNANWHGLLSEDDPVAAALRIVVRSLGRSADPTAKDTVVFSTGVGAGHLRDGQPAVCRRILARA